MSMKVSIIGAGKLGTALARLSVAAGNETLVYARPKPMLDLILSTVVPEAQLVSFEEAAAADVVILALPRTALASFDFSQVTGVMIDATNPWAATGTVGEHTALDDLNVPVIRTLNHISYEELTSDSQVLNPNALLRAVAVVDAGAGTETAVELVRSLGFEPVVVPPASAGLFEPDGELFGAWLTSENIRTETAQ